MKPALFVFFILLAVSSRAQVPERYELKLSHEIESQVANGKLSITSASYRYTYIGDYAQAIISDDIDVSWGLDTMLRSDIQFLDAVDYIDEIAGDFQVVIISESHMKPQHRVFSSKVISALYDKGFRHLGLETLTPSHSGDYFLQDTALNERGYALFSPKTGTYSKEPNMASLIRSACSRGYSIFAYERGEKVPGKDRDEIQADNVIKYLKAHPGNKLILHCGFHHAIESKTEKYKGRDVYWLAYYLKKKTGIDPLTIYQDNFTEKVAKNQHPILDTLNLKVPSVAIDKLGNAIKWSDKVDLEVFHPRTTYVNGRPDWLFKNPGHKIFAIDTDGIRIAYPLLAKAYKSNEGPLSVPYDVIEIKSKYDNKYLVLEKGDYLLILDNKVEKQEMKISVK